ncbi:TetR/AcrR family transcriptional regulator [Actinomadura parmotrematis]|uniref:TetR family transcriptional regulator n=1 Tax=Actinomadura parmotrematis TaxID=2864039 RepID=A0ABS7G0Q2_9ACTN|nr:TetR/AcrR family transcriptional regulator [Actinomadura parmotrematis]MBW8486292.1 TetR family transcriptional regulator [Actinomadura parmotrematis]
MPRDARATRASLLRAGARLFAEQGIDAARTRDIVALAGQANDSAVTYHFGSRQGLLAAILRAGVARMEPARARDLADLDGTDLDALVAAIVRPLADEARSEEGRDFLRIVAQVAGLAGVRRHALPEPVAGTALARQLDLLEKHLTARLPEPVALERMAALIAFLTAALADRTAQSAPLLPHDAYTAELTAMLAAALRAPTPWPA